MKKGIIIELREQYAYVLSHNGKMKKIKREYYHEIGQEVQLPLIQMRKIIPVVLVACAVVIAIVLNPMQAIPEVKALSYLSLSVNPGLVLKVDDQNQIVAVSYTNQEGKLITDEVDFINKSLDESVIIFIDYCFEYGYFQENNQIDINVISDDKERITDLENQVQTLIENYLAEHQVTISIQIDEVTTSQQESAESLGIPDTKLKLIDLILYYYPELNKEKLAKKSVDDLIEYLEDKGYDEHMLDHLEDMIEENEKNSEEEKEEKTEKTNQTNNTNNQSSEKNSSNRKKISGEEAKKIALDAVGSGHINEVDYDHDDNIYEIEVKTKDNKYEVEIDAQTGKVLKLEKD